MHHFRPLFICHNISHAVLLALIWLNEILDLPYALGIGIKSSANFAELIIESIALLAVYLTSIIILNKICHRIKIRLFSRICGWPLAREGLPLREKALYVDILRCGSRMIF